MTILCARGLTPPFDSGASPGSPRAVPTARGNVTVTYWLTSTSGDETG